MQSKINAIKHNPFENPVFIKDEESEALAYVRNTCSSMIKGLIAEISQSSEEEIKSILELSVKKKDLPDYFLQIPQSRSNLAAVTQLFFEYLDAEFDSLDSLDDGSSPNFEQILIEDSASLTVDIIDELMILEHITSKSIRRFDVELRNLSGRFNTLATTDVNIENLPIGPKKLTECFCRALKGSGYDMGMRRVYTRLFEKCVLMKMAFIYRSIGKTLESRGIHTTEDQLLAQLSGAIVN